MHIFCWADGMGSGKSTCRSTRSGVHLNLFMSHLQTVFEDKSELESLVNAVISMQNFILELGLFCLLLSSRNGQSNGSLIDICKKLPATFQGCSPVLNQCITTVEVMIYNFSFIPVLSPRQSVCWLCWCLLSCCCSSCAAMSVCC